jgi:hypothetical protein
MKTIFLIVIFFYSNIFFSQNKIYLSELDTTLNNEIKKQGFKLFKKSKYYEKKINNYNTINSFWVLPENKFNDLDFSSKKDFLKKLYFERTSKCKFVNVIHWNIIYQDTLFNNDFKRFYKCSLHQFAFKHIKESIKKFNFSNIFYTFYLEISNGFIEFIVLKDGAIFVFDSKKELMYTFEEFGNLLKQTDYLNEFYPEFFRNRKQ